MSMSVIGFGSIAATSSSTDTSIFASTAAVTVSPSWGRSPHENENPLAICSLVQSNRV